MFPVNAKKRIQPSSILRYDVLWWIIGAGVSVLLFIAVFSLVASIRPDMDSMDVGSILYTTARPFYIALAVIGVLIARRSFSTWTWVLIVILVFGFMSQTSYSLSVILMPNSILNAMVAMLGLLAAGRIVEYLHMRYIIKLDEPRLSTGGILIYTTLILGATLLNSSLFYDYISR